MRPRDFILGLLVVGGLSLPCSVRAQRVLHDARDDVRDGATDVYRTLTSPARMSTRDLQGLGVVAAGGGLLLLLDDDIDEWIVAHPDAAALEPLKPFRLGSNSLVHLGDSWFWMRLSAAAWLAGLAFDSDDVRDAAMGCAAATAAQVVVRRYVLYKLVSRSRPAAAGGDAYDFDVPGGDWDHRSFPGGHTANAFTCISFLNERFDLGLIEPVLYVVAGAVAAGRTVDRAHWASDNFLGAALGYTIGKNVAAGSRGRAKRDAAKAGVPQNELQLGMRGGGLYIGFQRTF